MLTSSLFLVLLGQALACTDFYMNFTDHRLSARTVDLGLTSNWTISSWPRASKAVDVLANKLAGWSAPLGTLGFTANWFGDEKYGFPSLFGDSLNEKGLSCSLLALVGTQYEERADDKVNVFAGLFCHYVASNYADVFALKNSLDGVRIWGPDALAQHFAVRDINGNSLVIECIGGSKRIYLDVNDDVTGYGIMTNEPTFDWHLEHIGHYNWKRTLSRQAVATPGNFYPEERFLRAYMMKQGLQKEGFMATTNYQQAVSLTAQVLNSVTVPQGAQYGTDTGESSGEGTKSDHTLYGVIRDHANQVVYYRDATNPTFRRISLRDLDFSEGAKRLSVKLEDGAFFVDMTKAMQ